MWALGHEWLISIKSNGVIPGDVSLRDFAHKSRSAYTYKSAPAVSGEQRKRRHSSSLTSKPYRQFTFALSTAEISIVVLVLLNSGLNWRKQFWNLALGASKARLWGEQLMNRLQAGVCREMHTCHRKTPLALAQQASFATCLGTPPRPLLIRA